MKIEIIGSGGAFDKISNSYLINDKILIDCGETAVTRLIETEKINNITDIFITHIHQDHIGGLEKLLYYRLVFSEFKKTNIKIHCFDDIKAYYKTLAVSVDPTNGKYFQPFEFNIFKRKDKIISFVDNDNIIVEKENVIHMNGTIPSFGFIFKDKNSKEKVFFTGDTDKVKKINIYNTIIFHDMGWTGLPLPSNYKFHPTEEEIYNIYGKTDRIIGTHTTKKLKYYKLAKSGDIFEI